MARKRKCCVRRKRGVDGRMHCAKWKPPSKARKCVPPKYGSRRAAPRKAARRRGSRRGVSRNELSRMITSANKMKCTNPNRQRKLFGISHYIEALGAMEKAHGVPLRGVAATQRRVNVLKKQYMRGRKAVAKCFSKSTAIVRAA